MEVLTSRWLQLCYQAGVKSESWIHASSLRLELYLFRAQLVEPHHKLHVWEGTHIRMQKARQPSSPRVMRFRTGGMDGAANLNAASVSWVAGCPTTGELINW